MLLMVATIDTCCYSLTKASINNLNSLTINKPELRNKVKITTKKTKKATIVEIKFNSKEINIAIGESLRLHSSVKTTANMKYKINYKSSDKRIASVDAKGVVSGIAFGQVTITAEVGGKKATIKVKVKVIEPKVTSFDIKVPNSMDEGEIGKVEIIIAQKWNQEAHVSFSVDNDKIVSIDNQGNLKAISPGAAHIVVKVNDMAVSALIIVNINESKKLERVNKLAPDIHTNAWLDVATKAAKDVRYKYAIYASRTLSVNNPEVYLQGDNLFYYYAKRPYMRETYEFRSQKKNEREALIESFGKNQLGGNPFLWSDVNIKKYITSDYSTIYKDYPMLSYLDKRMFSVESALMGTDWKAVPINMVEFMYFKHKANGEKPYILFMEDGNAYLYSNNQLYSCNGENISAVKGEMILAFNENNVWYPLFDRDDTQKDAVLNKIVSTYRAAAGNSPSLNENEKRIIGLLKKNTKLETEMDFDKLQLVVSKIYYNFYPLRGSSANKTAQYENSSLSVYKSGVIYKIGNYLSPATAYYAALAKLYENSNVNEFTTIVQKEVAERYHSGAENGRYTVALRLWLEWDDFFSTMDDFILTKSSMCMFSATNQASIFELANIENLKIYMVSMCYSNQTGGHIYTAFYRRNEMRIMEHFSDYGNNINGLQTWDNSVMWRGFIDGDEWYSFHDGYTLIQSDDIYTSSTKEDALSMLLKVKEISKSKANMCIYEGTYFFGIYKPSEYISIDEFIRTFDKRKVISVEYK